MSKSADTKADSAYDDSGGKAKKSPETSTTLDSMARKLRDRGSQGDLYSTESLVTAFNETEDAEERSILRHWLQSYTDWFETYSVRHLVSGVFEEMALLVRIKSHCPEDDDLVRRTLFFLGDEVRNGGLEKTSQTRALAIALQMIDVGIFEGDPTVLLKVATILRSELDVESTVFTQETHPTHSVTLFALHQTLLLVQRIAPNILDRKQKDGYYAAFKDDLAKIIKCHDYFPSLFQVTLVEESLELLAEDSPLGTHDMSRCASPILPGLPYLHHGVQHALQAALDLPSLRKSYNRLDGVLNDKQKGMWYVDFIMLATAATIAINDSSQIDDFWKWFKVSMETQRMVSKKGDAASLLRFGVISQLCHVALIAPLDEFQRDAVTELAYLGTRFVKYEGWDDPAIVEAIVEALHYIRVKGKSEGIVEIAVEDMQNSKQPHSLVRAIERWLDSRLAEEKLQESDEPIEVDYLFRMVRTSLGIYSHKEIVSKEEELKSTYKTSEFTKVPGILDEQKEKDITQFEFHIVYYEEDGTSNNETDGEKESQHEEAIKRTHRTQHSVTLANIFSDRCINPNEHAQHISKVLLYGNPGSGKTTLGKKIVHDWSEKKWGSRFDAVYLLYVRELNKKHPRNTGKIREMQTLENAIAKSCFRPIMEDHEYKTLISYIEDSLMKESTLVIIDGLDESDANSTEIFVQAFHKHCSLLLLTRPYNLNKIRKHVQVEMECLGLNDEQLEEFIEKELSKPTSTKLLEFIKSCSQLWQCVHIPFTANVVCLLWKEKEKDDELEINYINLYSHMANFIWDRFRRKSETKLNRKDAFEALEDIAFDSWSEGKILINRATIKEHCSKSVSDDVIKHSGFFLLKNEGVYFQFVHLTFQEYFAGQWLAHHLFGRNTTKKIYAEKFIKNQKYERKFRIAITFAIHAVCWEYGPEGFKYLLHLIEETNKTHDSLSHATLQLTVLEALIGYKRKEPYLDIDEIEGVSKVLDDVKSCLEGIKKLKKGEFDRLDKNNFCEIKLAPKAVLLFEELFDTLMEGSSGVCYWAAYEMFNAVTHIARRSQQHEQKLLRYVSAECSSESTNNRTTAVAFLLSLAEIVPEFHEPIITLVIKASEDEAKDVRCMVAKKLKHFCTVMPKHFDTILSLAEAASRDGDVGVRSELSANLGGLAKEMVEHHDEIFDMTERASKDKDVEVRSKLLTRSLIDLVKEMHEHHNAIVDVIKKASRDIAESVRSDMVADLRNLAKEMPQFNDVVTNLVACLSEEKVMAQK